MEKITRRYYSIRELSEYAGVSQITIRACIHDGTLNAYRLGKRILIDIEEFNTALRERKVTL